MAIRCIAFGGIVYNFVVGMTKQEYDKRYYQLHRERILERCKRRYWEKKGDVTKIAEKKAKRKIRYDKRWREENRAYWRWYYREHKEKINEQCKEYYKQNAERIKEQSRARYAAKKATDGRGAKKAKRVR